MERREPYLNKIFPAVIFAAFLILAWLTFRSGTGSGITLEENSPGLSHAGGVVYYNGDKFTGVIIDQYPNGNLAKQAPYVNGRQDGVMKLWSARQVLLQERYFSNGQKQGIHKGWWPDGTPAFEYTFKDDEYNGTVKEWYPNGRPFRVFHYAMGHEDGLQQMWWENNTVRANYVVKDGQQYGLIGRKLCRNAAK